MPTLSDIVAKNDAFRSTLKGGVVLMTPAVWELDARERGRAIYRMTQAQRFTDVYHSEGVFTHGGRCFYWYIGTFAGQHAITLSLSEDWIGVRNIKRMLGTAAL
jgi:hypothetical protein